MKELMNYLLVPVLALFTTTGAVQAAVESDEEEQQTEKHLVVVKVAGDDEQAPCLTVDAGANVSGLATLLTEEDDEGASQVLKLHTLGAPCAPSAIALAAASDDDPSRGWLGVILGEVSPALAAQLELEDEGVMISNVARGSPAAEAGLARYDVIVEVNGEGFGGSTRALAKRLGELGSGAAAELTVIRSGKEQTVPVELGSRPDPEEMEWKYEWSDLSSVTEKFRHRGRVMMRGPDGKVEVHDLGDLKALKELPDSIRCLIPGMKDICTRVWVDQDKGSVGVHITTRVEEDGQAIEIEQEDGKITVRRTTVDDQGNSQTTEQTYDDADALKAADEEAYELYSGIQGPHVLDLHLDHLGDLDFDVDLDLDDLLKNLHEVKKGQTQWRAQLKESLKEAGKAYEEAMKSLDSIRPFKFQFGHRGMPSWVDEPERARQSFSVGPDGRIEVRLRKGDSEVVMTYDSEDDLAKRNPEMYEKYSEVINAPVEK